VIQKFGVGEAEFAADTAKTQVAGAEDETTDASGYEGSGAHDAGLEGTVQSGVFQTVVASTLCGFAEGEDLGVRGGIGAGDGAVPGAAKDLIVNGYDGPDGHFAERLALAGEAQGFLHEVFVGGH
jgi:hypothetical protein